MKRSLLVYLRGILASLKPTERLIAECVLADPEKVITSSIAEIRKDSGASVGSIVGFCRRLGLKGFADFKIALARDLAQAGLSAGDAQQNGSLFEKVFHFHAQSLMETLQINSEASFERAAQVIEKARKIEFFSIGISYPVAYTAYCKFQLIGLAASSQFDSHIQLIAATQMRPSDVAFGISCSGTTRETVQCLEVAKAQRRDHHLSHQCHEVSYHGLCRHCALRHAQRDQVLSGSPGFARHATSGDRRAVCRAGAQEQDRTAGRLQQSGEELLRRRID